MHSPSPPSNLPSPPPDSSPLHPLSPPEGISGKAKAASPLVAMVEMKDVDSKPQDGEFVRQVEEGDVGNGGVPGERRLRPSMSILRKTKRKQERRSKERRTPATTCSGHLKLGIVSARQGSAEIRKEGLETQAGQRVYKPKTSRTTRKQEKKKKDNSATAPAICPAISCCR